MTIQTLTVILCSLVIICSRKIGVEATVFTTSLNRVTWESARNRCALRNETFATLSLDTTLSRRIYFPYLIDADLKLDVNQPLWVGNVLQYHYFMFKVQPEPFSIKTEPGQEDVQMCGTILVQANTAREITMVPCSIVLQTWCEKNSTISMEGKCNSARKIWAKSKYCCTASRLPQVLPKTIKDFTFNISPTTKTYIWTALLRESIVIDHKRLHGLLHPESKCAYVMKVASGEIELHFGNCTTYRRYICSGPTTEGASPMTSVVTSISTSTLSSTLSSSMSTEGIIDIISGASGKDDEKTRNLYGLLVIINVVFLCWKGCSKRRTTVATTDQVVHGQEESLPLNDTVHTYEGLIGASVMTRPDPNNYDVLDVGIDDTVHTYEGLIGASVMTRPDSNNYDVLDVGIDDTEHTYEGVIEASVMTRHDSNNYVDMNAGIHM